MGFITVITGFLGSIIENIASSLITDKAKEYSERNNSHLSFSFFQSRRRKYFKDLALSIRRMPFIYNNIGIEVTVEDFISIEFKKLDNRTLKLDSPKFLDNLKSKALDISVLKENTKLIILGNAGIGKTTLLTSIAYSIITGKEILGERFSKKKIIPIYIPLKAVHNVAPSPIIKYLLERNILFSHKNGYSDLLKLLGRREIFLILDGYDEINFSNKENYLREEVTLLLSSFVSSVSYNVNHKYDALYKLFASSKVWLSTREEFYRLNPLESVNLDAGNIIMDAQSNVPILQITGLGHNRILYVEKIFNHYRSKGDLFSTNLNEELFIDNIDSSGDDELKKMSNIPLFLNVMCYIYARKIEKTGHLNTEWEGNLSELILECVRLLLEDLDLYKVRDLSAAQREAFKKRRNAYTTEKEVFLQYFSLQLLSENKSVFDRNYMVKKVKKYFHENKDLPNSKRILDDFVNSSRNNPDFAQQLLYSGLFHSVDIVNNDILFDMPHRRFREVLALEALVKFDNFSYLLDNIYNPGLSEIISLAFRSKKIDREKVLERIVQSIDEYNAVYLNNLLKNLLKEFDVNVNDFIINQLSLLFNQRTVKPISVDVVRLIDLKVYRIEPMLRYQDYDYATLHYVLSILSLKGEELYSHSFTKLESLYASKTDNFSLVLGKFNYFNHLNKRDQVDESELYQLISSSDYAFKYAEYGNIILIASNCHSYYQFTESICLFFLKKVSIDKRIIYLAALERFDKEIFSKYKALTEYYNYFQLLDLYKDDSYYYTSMKQSQLFYNINDSIHALQQTIRNREKEIKQKLDKKNDVKAEIEIQLKANADLKYEEQLRDFILNFEVEKFLMVKSVITELKQGKFDCLKNNLIIS